MSQHANVLNDRVSQHVYLELAGTEESDLNGEKRGDPDGGEQAARLSRTNQAPKRVSLRYCSE